MDGTGLEEHVDWRSLMGWLQRWKDHKYNDVEAILEALRDPLPCRPPGTSEFQPAPCLEGEDCPPVLLASRSEKK